MSSPTGNGDLSTQREAAEVAGLVAVKAGKGNLAKTSPQPPWQNLAGS